MSNSKFYRMCSRFGVVLAVVALTAVFFIKPATQHAQTSNFEILLESKFDGANNDGWTFSNGTQTNKWFVGTAAGNSGGGSTNNAAYISNSPVGATFAYDNAGQQTYSHMYRNIDFPAELGMITVSFDFRGIGEGGLDLLRVFLIPSNVVPQPGGAITVGEPMVGHATLSTFINGEEEYTRVTLRQFNPTYAPGNTRRLVFTWQNDGNSVGGPTPIAIDNIVISARSTTALAGSYTVDESQPSGTTNFNALGEAFQTINQIGVGGATTFNVAAGQTLDESLFELVASGTAANPITFQKSGAGDNPVVRSTGGGGLAQTQTDGAIKINGGNYFTFDGIDVQARITQNPLINKLDYGYYLRNLNNQNGAKFNTIKNCSISLDRTNSSSVGIIQAANSPLGTIPIDLTGTNNGNKYLNIKIQNANAGIYLAGNAAFPDDGTEIGTTDASILNTIGTATPDDIGSPTNINAPVFGIRAGAQSNLKIYNTEIRNLLGTGGASGTVDGIWLENSGTGTVSLGTSQVYNNRIHDLRHANATGARVSGIRSSLTNNAASVAQISNNFIYHLESPTTTTNQRNLVGIRVQEAAAASATHEIYFNSVRLAPVGITGSNTAFEIGNTTSIFKIQNNIFANFTGTQSGGAKHYAFVTPTASSIGAAGSVSDNNILHIANPGNGFVGLSATTDRVNLPAWRTVTGTNDANSRSQNPQFVSATDLHIRTDVPTPVESAGTAIAGFTTDIDGNTRNATTPDIGADEGAFQPLVIIANDIAAASIFRPTPGSLVAQGTTLAPQAIFQNVGGATQTNINVRLTITGPGGYNYSNDKTIATLDSEAATTVTFDAAPAFNQLGIYTVTATLLTADGNASNNTISSTFQVSAPLSGDQTVGAGGSFPNLATAIQSLNAVGVSAPTTFLLTEANYNVSTSALVINPVAGASSTNRVVIKPAPGVNATITGTVGFGGMIVLNGADFVTIDGSNSDAPTRNLTLINNSTNIHAVIFASSNGNTDGAQNNVFKNLNITAGGTLSTNYIGISFSGTNIGTAGLDHDNNRIENCHIQRAGRAIFFQGAGAANKNEGNVITGNVIGNAGTGDIGHQAIYTALENNLQITENVINARNTTGNDAVGISLGLSDVSTTPTGLEVTNAVVARNRIESVVGEQGLGSAGIAVAPATSGTNLIVNNFIAGVISPSAGTNNISAGILLGGGAGSTTQIYHNTVSMTGNRGTINNQLGSFAVAIGGSDPTIDLRNNILSNTQTQFGAGTTGKSYAVGTVSATFANLTSEKNLFYTEGVQAVFGITGGLINTTGTEQIDLAAWRTTTGKDANSIFANPLFRSLPDLHLRPSSPARNAASVIGLITTDVDGQARDTTPDIGADEFRKAADDDFDADGRADLSVFRPSEGRWYSNRSSAGFSTVQFGLSTDKITPADYDGDGKTDQAVFRDGIWYILRSLDNSVQIIQWGISGDIPAPADYDGDGNADIAVFRPAEGDWYILQSTNNQLRGLHWGLNGDVPVAGDYDADSKTDIAVFRPSTGVWYILRSGDSGATVEPFGLNGDVPLAGDFNGDGRADLAVFRPSNRTWYIARPTGVPAQNFDSIPFGLATDKPVPADYDGDGRADVAVYRGGTWYILRSTSGLLITQFGLSNDTPVPAAFQP